MSPIGRIFIVANLILSACFLGWASNALATVQDYKMQLDQAKAAHKTEVEGKDKEISNLQVDNNGLSEQQRKFREERDQFKTESESLKTQLDELKRANDQMQASLTQIQATLGDFNQTIAQLTQQKDAAVEARHEAERARDGADQKAQDAELAQRDAEEATKNAKTMVADLEKDRAELRDKVSDLETRLEVMFGKTGIRASDVYAQPKIEAAVLSVNPGLKMVVLNKGSKDGVKTGFTFSVYRGSQFKGQVRIDDVQENLCSGQILNMKTAIATGDSATTSF